MDSMPDGVLVYFAVSTIVAGIIHWRLRRYLLASGMAAVIAPVGFALVCLLFADTPTAVEPKIVAFFAAISLVVALAVGLAFVIPRRLSRNGS